MTVYVFRNGVLVEKQYTLTSTIHASEYPSPNISRLEPYQSPIDGKEITSWRQRDKDLRDSNSVDPRDLKVKRHARRTPEPTAEQLSFQWADTGSGSRE